MNPFPPMVVVHGPDDLRLAVLAARTANLQQLGLLSAPSAACYLGAAWWRELMALATSPGDPALIDILDCGDAAGRAMEALRLGQRLLVLSPRCPQFDAVTDRAAVLGATVLTDRPAALDLGANGATRRLADWLTSPPARVGSKDKASPPG